MKFEFLFLFFLFSIGIKINGQEVVDTAGIKCTYKLAYLFDSLDQKRVTTDILNLFIGKKYSWFFSYITYAADSAFKVDIEGGKISPEQLLTNKQLQKTYTHGGVYSLYKLYIDNAENRIIITDKINTNKYIYEEKKEQINWAILPDTLTILNYLCQKATGSFRGRIYTAWFTPEVPIDAGPYKFSGLPGLIIKIADSKNNYSYECIGVEQLNVKRPIIIESKNCIKTTRTEFRKAFKATFENPWESLISSTSVTLGGRDIDKIRSILQKSIPYNPIELK